jgi:hypothetical protein
MTRAMSDHLCRWSSLQCRTIIIAFLTMLILPSPSPASADQPSHAMTLFGAVLIKENPLDFRSEFPYFEESYLTGIALARRFARTGRSLTWEVEGQAVKHYGKQHHGEFNTLLFARWHRFPWNGLLLTSIALGEGLSLATRTPLVEREDHSKSSALLNNIQFELTFALPHQPHWHLVGRIHHRSGIFGLINGVHAASDFAVIGLKRNF